MKSKQPIALIITDTHLSDTNHEVNISIYKQAIALAKKLKLTSIEHGGDLFHSRKAQTQKNLNCLGDIFKLFEEARIELNVVVGNHDKTEYSIAKSFLDTYKHHPFVKIHRIGGGRTLTNEIYLSYLSYFSDVEYVESIKEVYALKSKFTKKKVLLTHIGVNGAVMNNGTVIETKIDKGLFKPFDLTLIGHYHDAQVISSKIKYIGASVQHNFGEKPVKGATILYDDLSTELIPFEFPQYLAFEVQAKDFVLKDIEDFKLAAKESGNHLRIVLTGTDAEIKSVDKQRLIAVGIDVTSKSDPIMQDEVEESIVAFTDTSILEAFTAFCEKNKLDEKEGLKYLKQAVC